MLLSTKGPSAMTSIENDPAQVPNSQPNNNPDVRQSTDLQVPAYTEHVNTRGTQEAFGRDRVPSFENPSQPRIDQDPNKKGKNYRAVAIASIAVGSVIAAGIGAKAYIENSNVNNIANNLTDGEINQDGNLSAPGIDLDNNTATLESKSLSRVQELDYAGPILNSDTSSTLARMNTSLAEMGWGEYGYFERPIVEPSVDNTAQQIWDQIALGEFQAWEAAQSGTPEAMSEAMQLAKGVVDGREYTDLVETFANGGTAVIPVGLVPDDAESPVFTTGKYKDIENSGYGIKIFSKVNPIAGEGVRVTARLESGTVDNSMRWVLVKTEKAAIDDISPGSLTQLN